MFVSSLVLDLHRPAEFGGLATTSSVGELIGHTAVTFRESIKKYVVDAADLATKVASVVMTLEKLRRHVADGTFPSILQGCTGQPYKPPRGSKRGYSGVPADLAAFKKTWSDTRSTLLRQMVDSKDKEGGTRELITMIETCGAKQVMLPPIVVFNGTAHHRGWYTEVLFICDFYLCPLHVARGAMAAEP